MHRKMLLGLAATMFSVVGVGTGVGVQAASATVNHFRNGAPGSVTCLFQLNIHFKRAIHPLEPGLTTSEKMSGRASSCTTNQSLNPFGVTTTVRSAAIPGVWTTPDAGIVPDGTPYTCGVSFGSTGAVSSGWTFKWQAATYVGNGFSGGAQFVPTTASPIQGSISGDQLTLSGQSQNGGLTAPLSFQGQVAGTLTQTLPTTSLSTLCARNALGSVQFTGYVTIGGETVPNLDGDTPDQAATILADDVLTPAPDSSCVPGTLVVGTTESPSIGSEVAIRSAVSYSCE